MEFEILVFFQKTNTSKTLQLWQLRNETLITSKTFEPNLTGFQNLSGLVSCIIQFSFLNITVPKLKQMYSKTKALNSKIKAKAFKALYSKTYVQVFIKNLQKTAQNYAEGNSTINVAPFPNSVSHHTLPSMTLTNFFTMNKPNPVECSSPLGRGVKRANLPNN